MIASHHALFCYSTAVDNSLLIKKLIATELPAVEISEYKFAQLGITEVRSLLAVAYRRPQDNYLYRVVVVETSQITNEAQQAFLKLLEDPPETTRFFLCLAPPVKLIPTLRSRLAEVKLDTDLEKTTIANKAWQEFYETTMAKRLEQITNQMKKDNPEWFSDIQAGLTKYLQEQPPTAKGRTELARLLPFMGSRGSSSKMLLEEIAFTLPER